ncbi:ADAM 6 protein precursor [Cavia porcellus]|uniref:ADAM 6 protein n=1 Tax=Cavia porcellus TaxID=10141 RepID=Q60473_CAVPO|nr:ADAM 6 protein precursor [Cavia porcellus]AAA74919.1 ADAM 6 protein precursor [Cavia porcellus]
MRMADRHRSLRAPLLLLGLWALLGPVQAFPDHPSWRYVSAEVVIPRRHTHSGKGLQVAGRLSYSLRFGGQRHIIHLQRNTRFQPKNLPVITQNDQGALQMEHPYIPLDCSYIGYVEEVPYSMANIDTCYGGLEGIMKLDDLTYEIKPLQDSLIFEHIVSQIVADVNETQPRRRPADKRPSPLDGAKGAPETRIPSKVYVYHPVILKGFIQSPNEVYLKFGSNRTNTIKFMLRFGGAVKAIVENISIIFIVNGLSIYDTGDPLQINDFRVPDGTVFQHYQRTFYLSMRPNIAFLILLQGPYELDVAPPYYGVCNDKHLIFLGLRGRHYFLGAVIGAHQLGRAFGLFYDEAFCQCQRRATCVMFKHPVLTDAFSNCSYVHLAHIIGGLTLWCLYFTSFTYYNETETKFFCGNRIVDEGELCDCGTFKQCYTNPCCQTTCMFTAGSICDGQDCCTNCTYSPSGTLCRPIRNICDLPEYCTGSQLTCPENLYMQDGTPCTEEGYCYQGNCSDLTIHCREIFGEKAMKGELDCYQINLKGNRFGHCRRRASQKSHIACATTDVGCGRLQCSNVTHLPRLQEHVSFHQSKFGNSWCFGVDEHRETQTLDVGFVRDGALCAPGKYCLNTYCSGSVPSISYDCEPQKCNFRGICNNKKECHCHIGRDPHCANKGAGGSESSRPPPHLMRTVSQSIEPVRLLRIIFGRIYAFIAVLLLGVATNVRSIKTITVPEGPAPEAPPPT